MRTLGNMFRNVYQRMMHGPTAITPEDVPPDHVERITRVMQRLLDDLTHQHNIITQEVRQLEEQHMACKEHITTWQRHVQVATKEHDRAKSREAFEMIEGYRRRLQRITERMHKYATIEQQFQSDIANIAQVCTAIEVFRTHLLHHPGNTPDEHATYRKQLAQEWGHIAEMFQDIDRHQGTHEDEHTMKHDYCQEMRELFSELYQQLQASSFKEEGLQQEYHTILTEMAQTNQELLAFEQEIQHLRSSQRERQHKQPRKR